MRVESGGYEGQELEETEKSETAAENIKLIL